MHDAVNDADIDGWAKEFLVSDDHIYEPQTGDYMCLYTTHGVYGPVIFEDHAYHCTFTVREPLVNTSRLTCYGTTMACVERIQKKITTAREEVAEASGRGSNTDFTHVRFFNIEGTQRLNNIVLTVDVGISCSARSKYNLLDHIFGNVENS